jgi:hypothetical protein
MYSGQKLRGVIYTFGAAASLVTLALVDRDYRDRRDDFNNAKSVYENARSIEEKSRLKPGLEGAQQKAYDAETTRNIAFGVAAVVWALNIIDAAAFFPESGYAIGGPAAISLDTGDSFDRVQVNLALNF